MRVPRPERRIVDRFVDMMTLEAEGWRLVADGIRKDDSTLVERGQATRNDASGVFAFGRGGRAAPRNQAAVSGRVLSVGGSPVTGAAVSIVCLEGGGRAARDARYLEGCRTPRATSSDTAGRFEFQDLPPGPCTATVHADGCAEQTRSVEVVDVTGIAFSLRPLVDPLSRVRRDLAALEQNSSTTYRGLAASLQARTMPPEQFAAAVESRLVRPWKAA